jgi:putative colanic acid biosynthesis acetyltransferase WcaF
METKHTPRVNLKDSGVKWDRSQMIRRMLWLAVTPLFRFSPKKLGNGWRCWLINRFGGDIDRMAWIFPSVRITDPSLLTVREWAVLGPAVEIYNYAAVEIGARTVISQRCFLCTASHDYTHSRFPMFWKPIKVGEDAWLAEGVMVFPGVSIASGSVVGARSVVTADTQPWTVNGGNPCRIIKPRILKK